eukprot:gene11178-18791_t
MVMPLLVPASGQLHYVIPEGGVLASGDLIAQMDLGDAEASMELEQPPQTAPVVTGAASTPFAADTEVAAPAPTGPAAMGNPTPTPAFAVPPPAHVVAGLASHHFIEASVSASLYEGSFPELGPPCIPPESVSERFQKALEDCKMVMAGKILYLCYVLSVDGVVEALATSLDTPLLAKQQWEGTYALVRGLLPSQMASQLEGIVSSFAGSTILPTRPQNLPLLGTIDETSDKLAMAVRVFPCDALAQVMEKALAECSSTQERDALASVIGPLQVVTKHHSKGPEEYVTHVVSGLLEDFLSVEEPILASDGSEQGIVAALVKVHGDNMGAVLEDVMSHKGLRRKADLGLRRKADLVIHLMSRLVQPDPSYYRPFLRRFAMLKGKGTAHLAARARTLLAGYVLQCRQAAPGKRKN